MNRNYVTVTLCIQIHALTHSLAVATQRLRYVVADAVLVSVLAAGGGHGSRDRGRARRGRTHWHQGVRRRAHLLHRSQRHGLQPTDPGTANTPSQRTPKCSALTVTTATIETCCTNSVSSVNSLLFSICSA